MFHGFLPPHAPIVFTKTFAAGTSTFWKDSRVSQAFQKPRTLGPIFLPPNSASTVSIADSSTLALAMETIRVSQEIACRSASDYTLCQRTDRASYVNSRLDLPGKMAL